MNFVIYALASGEILRTGNAPASMIDLQAGEGEGALVDITADDAMQYVDLATLAIIDRPAAGAAIDKASVIADGADACTITGIPAGTGVTIRGPDQADTLTVDDGSLSLAFEQAGIYNVILKPPFPALGAMYNIQATEPSL